ncbi:EAL and HDOD domain-containing protein [Candidatus Latescibacterota bacterium]
MDVFVARQPIFNKILKVYAYELLFRVGGDKNEFSEIDGDVATSSVITDSFLVIGMDSLTRGKKAFINFTENLLMDETATILPKNDIVIELLEDIMPSEGIIAACKKLRELGYTLALDDFVFEPKFQPLIDLAHIIKVDFTLSDEKERAEIVRKFAPKGIKFLAEKVETQEEFDKAVEDGYTYFQGYFFSKPQIISSRDIPGNKIAQLKILQEVNRPEIDFNKIETIVRSDVSISFKLLKFINSAFFAFSTEIHSIKQALVLMGVREFRKWVSLIIMRGMASDKPEEILVTSLVRARFCELVAKDGNMEDRSSDLFFMGIFSMIDTLMSRPMEEILVDLPLPDDIKGALLSEEGLIRDLFELIIAYEAADWDTITALTEKNNIPQSNLHDHYINALDWANQFLYS